MKPSLRIWSVPASAVLLDLVSIAVAYGYSEDASVKMSEGIKPSETSSLHIYNSTEMGPSSYFRYTEYNGLILLHIVLMSIAWIFVLPLGVMLYFTRSRLNLLVQFVFLLLNSFGLLFGAIYNEKTPDLYPNNAHHRTGWLLICISCIQTCLAVLQAYTEKPKDSPAADEQAAFIPISTQAMEEHSRVYSLGGGPDYRFSNDSGQGTERNTESLKSHSTSDEEPDENMVSNIDLGYDAEHDISGTRGIRRYYNSDRPFLRKLPSILSSRTLRGLELIYGIINRVILILGFVAFTTGIVTYSGIFRGREIFSGLAHFIKGGVFFWYGILTLGRWAGCFAEFGWAWNIKPPEHTGSKIRKAVPSAEFVESFLIFFYGSTNVFLEHLGGWGGEWSSGDLEHISITIMFFGGGLCGMLVESRAIRDCLNAPVTRSASKHHENLYAGESEGEPSWQVPKSYRFSMNPLPALIVLLLGMMMSSHHQDSMVSTMIHKQWGTLLVGAAVARALTYIIFYLAPPVSILPSRPPSELITAFCLIAAGLIFMASAHDIMVAMETNELDAMFVFTISMGLVTFLMAWIIFVIAFKGWATRRDGRRNNY